MFLLPMQELREPLRIHPAEISCHLNDCVLTAKPQQQREQESAGPNYDPETFRALQPECPGQQHANADEIIIICQRFMDARRKKADGEIGVTHVHTAWLWQWTAQPSIPFPTHPHDEINGVQRNYFSRAEGLRGDEEEKCHWQPAE